MGSKASKAQHPAPVKSETQTALVPRLPQETTDEILDHLATDPDFRSLRSCALVSKSWVPSCRRHLFHTIILTRAAMERWLEMFPVPEESPAHFVKDLQVWTGPSHFVPEQFFEYTPWFTNVKSLSLLGYKGVIMMQRPLIWRSPQSVTSLTITTGRITLVEIRDIMAGLPNLDSLSLSGKILMNSGAPQGIGTVLRGRFGGKLRLVDKNAGECVTDMLLEVPTGIHFTEIQFEWPRKLLPSNIRLLEACSKTLVRLSYLAGFEHGKDFERSLDFSKLPNLQVVALKLGWMDRGLRWIPMALSTIKPATSPCLFTIRVDLTCSSPTLFSLTEDTHDDLRWVADEAVRIEREFGGVVNLTVSRDPALDAVLDALNVRFSFRGVEDTS